ncbi:tetratricopeptide repeat protein [Mucilaginibacter agri]|uniref:Tetratricopeptide repeat protein n=1 Tax=Mucilaginibacter agri TaxID=2695265 RepID=A0A965ZE56_9SPHI|nr:tetratricopeptide repeat protein [Mucilaginibacter agri]NCD68117.1 tetratricopeptide repeat protein [Mucilaginibacter agri]
MRLNLKSRLTFVCILICIGAPAFAQIIKQDSHKFSDDTATVESLRNKSRKLQSSRPDSALIYAEQGLSLSRKIGFKIGEGNCLNRLGVLFWKNGRYDRALSFLLSSLKLREEINDRLGVLKSLNDIGIIYADQGDNVKALTYHFKAKAVAESLHDKKRLSIVLSNIGNCYLKLNKIESALSYELQAYAIQHQLNDRASMPNTLSILGDINYKLGNIPMALEYYRLSIPYAIENDDQSAIVDTYNSMAKLFNKTNQADSSLYYALNALKTAKSAAYAEGIYNSSNILTEHYQGKNEHLELTYYKQAVAAKDTMFNAQKIKEVQILSFNEAERQHDLEEERQHENEQRLINLQLIGIAIFIPMFFLCMLLLSKSRVHRRVIEFMSVLSLLMFFEFVTLLIHPLVLLISNHLPAVELLILVILAAILAPIHHNLTHWLREKLAHVQHHSHHSKSAETTEND